MTSPSARSSRGRFGHARTVGIASALALAAVHLIEMPEHLEEMPYLGVLFGVGGLLLIAAAVGLFRNGWSRLAWTTGSLVAAGMFVGYVISRTAGLPGMEVESWVEPLGIVSLALEVVFLAAAAAALRAQPPRSDQVPDDHDRAFEHEAVGLRRSRSS